jgi:hypothetical protein
MLTTIPFCGFYDSLHDSMLDDAVEQMMSDESGSPYNGLVYKVQMDCRWKPVHEAYARAYCENFGIHFELKSLTFDELKSPKYYNFETDRIFATISTEEVARIASETNWDDFAELAKERFTSRSGFSSFYNPDYLTWGPVETWDHNQVGTLIELLVGEDFDHYKEYDLMEDDRGNGEIEGWISENTPNIGRLYNIADYLRTREARG